MSFKHSIIETMKRRQSVRTYDTMPINDEHYALISEYINNEGHLVGPFNRQGRIQLVKVNKNVTDKGIKIGTYGFIKNARAYLVGICENNKYSLVDFAYAFHKLVLFLTELNIGTCWMGGTFSRSSFEKEIIVNEHDFIPCVTPIGYPREKKRVFDKALRYVVKADNKKPWEQLFFDSTFNQALQEEKAGQLETPLEMVRIGPSASNKQPWRLVLSKDRKVVHLYIEHTPNYAPGFGYKMQLLDMGIAMCQFEMACQELNINGEWIVQEPSLQLLSEHTEYIASWQVG